MADPVPRTPDPFRADATDQAELVRRGEVEPRELVEATIERIERLDPRLGAVAIPLFDEARAAVHDADRLPPGPFRGVPFLMKDVGARWAGQPYTAGNRALRDAGYRAPADSPVGARLRALGLVVVGKSKVPEFGLQSTTQPLAFGPCRNPWNLDRSPGGSSGGAAAAVCAGLVPAAHASDGAGSIRIPASWCGLVGLKPSRGRILRAPTAAAHDSVEFVLARSLRDVAGFLDGLRATGAGGGIPAPLRSYREELGARPAPLRIGLLTRMPGGTAHPACVAGAEAAARLLQTLGHEVEASHPDALFEDEERRLMGLVFAPVEYRACLEELGEMLGREVGREDVEPYLWNLADPEGPAIAAEEFARAAEWQQAWAQRVSAWWGRGFDLLCTPTTGEPPPRLCELDGARHDPHRLVERMGPHMAFTEPFNATGQPAITLPLHWTDDRLPVGVQLVAALGRDDLLLRVAAQLQEATGWEERRPPIHC